MWLLMAGVWLITAEHMTRKGVELDKSTLLWLTTCQFVKILLIWLIACYSWLDWYNMDSEGWGACPLLQEQEKTIHKNKVLRVKCIPKSNYYWSVTLLTPLVHNNISNILFYTLFCVLFVNVLKILTLEHNVVLHFNSRATIPSPSSKKHNYKMG